LPFKDEAGMTLAPIRMKPDHPSTALLRVARIHFGRAYEIKHEVPVKSLGLIHSASMEDLLSHSKSSMYKNESRPKSPSGLSQKASHTGTLLEEHARRQQNDQPEPKAQPQTMPTDIGVGRDISNIVKAVLGCGGSTLAFRPLQKPVLGITESIVSSKRTAESASALPEPCKRFRPGTSTLVGAVEA
jgi:hypothetical protein